MYCSLSVEAIGNTYGETFISRWQDFESASPLAKIRLVAEHCRLQPDFSAMPWGIVPELIRFRNRIAHAKLEDISVDAVHPQADYEKYLYAKPESKLEKMVTERFAQQSYDSIYEILGLLATGLPVHTLSQLATEDRHGGMVAQNQQQAWPNHTLQRTAAGRRGCNRRTSWPPSLSLVSLDSRLGDQSLKFLKFVATPKSRLRTN